MDILLKSFKKSRLLFMLLFWSSCHMVPLKSENNNISYIAGIVAGVAITAALGYYIAEKTNVYKKHPYEQFEAHCMTPTRSQNTKITREHFYLPILYNNIITQNLPGISNFFSTDFIREKIANGTISRGDVVEVSALEGPWYNQIARKRLIGLPGDTITGTIEHGKPVIYLNGKKLYEPYMSAIKNVVGKKENNGKLDSYVYHPDLHNKLDSIYIINNELEPFIDHSDVYKKFNNVYEIDNKEIKDFQKMYTFHITLKDDEAWVMGDNRAISCDSRILGPIKIKYIVNKITIERVRDEYYGPYYNNILTIGDTPRSVLHQLENIKEKSYPSYYHLVFNNKNFSHYHAATLKQDNKNRNENFLKKILNYFSIERMLHR